MSGASIKLVVMFIAVVALVAGLVLLLVAAGLFWRAARPSGDQAGRHVQQQDAATPDPSVPAASTPSSAEGWGRPAANDESAPPQDEPETDAPAAQESTADEPAPEPVPASVSDDSASDSAVSADIPATAESTEPDGAEEPAAPTDTPESEHVTGGLFAGRRARRQWAQSHGYEYAKEDRYLPGEWPDSLISLITGDKAPVARDLVSGFISGHQFHIAEVDGKTVVALRREVGSPVRVHLSVSAGLPAGMRHSELCDRPPFTGYSTDNRALDRMLDSRAESVLKALGSVVSDVALTGTWVAVAMARRTDPPVWDHVLTQVGTLISASRVLPPRVTTVELDLGAADPTRPRVRHGSPGEPEEASREESADETPSAQRGHLRAVPDAATKPQDDPAEPDEPAAEEPSGRPHVERSSTPVDFPTRSEGQTMGDTTGWSEQGLGDSGEDADPIPAVGEDPDHTRNAGDGGPRVIRDATKSSTIFGDEASGPSRGKHRAPDARHASSDGEADDYEVVDPEVMDPDSE